MQVHKAQLHTGELVAVKVQYGDALATMQQDLVNVRAAAAFLSKTDLNFDLVSAVDELAKQIELEFDFVREAKVMDTIGEHLQVCYEAFLSFCGRLHTGCSKCFHGTICWHEPLCCH